MNENDNFPFKDKRLVTICSVTMSTLFIFMHVTKIVLLYVFPFYGVYSLRCRSYSMTLQVTLPCLSAFRCEIGNKTQFTFSYLFCWLRRDLKEFLLYMVFQNLGDIKTHSWFHKYYIELKYFQILCTCILNFFYRIIFLTHLVLLSIQILTVHQT